MAIRSTASGLLTAMSGVLVLTMFIVSAALSQSAAAKSSDENVDTEKTLKVSWETLLRVHIQVKETKIDTLFIPEFDESVAALDGKNVEIQGFMFPLVATTDIPDAEDHFLLSSVPASCPYFHIYSGQIIDVVAVEKVEFDEDNPVRIRGRLKLLRKNRDGLFYKITGATPIH